LEGFLSELLHEDFKIKQILESEGNKETEDDKFNRVDILVENKKGELVIVEIQNTREADYFQRMLYGTAKVIVEHIAEGQPYSQVKKVYSVNIVYFDLGQGIMCTTGQPLSSVFTATMNWNCQKSRKRFSKKYRSPTCTRNIMS